MPGHDGQQIEERLNSNLRVSMSTYSSETHPVFPLSKWGRAVGFLRPLTEFFVIEGV